MKSYLHRFYLIVIVWFIGLSNYGIASSIGNTDSMLVKLCMIGTNPVEDMEYRLIYNLDVAAFFSTDCNTSTVLTSGVSQMGSYISGANLYYSFSVLPGNHPNFDFAGNGDLVYDIIDNCVSQTPISGPHCAASTYLIRVSSPSSTGNTFTITATNYTSSVDITVAGISGIPDDVTICEGENMELSAVIGGGFGPYTYDWQLPDGSIITGNPIMVVVDPAIHGGTWVVTVNDAHGCTSTDDIVVSVNQSPPNDQCSTAEYVGTGFNPILFTYNNICARKGGPCSSPSNESAVYFKYKVPKAGLSKLIVKVPRFYVGVSSSCGGGSCKDSLAVFECPEPDSIVYITLSSSEANEGNYTMLITPVFEAPPITGSVFVDVDSDGQLGGNDIGLGGAEIFAYPNCDKGQTPITVTSNDNGSFTFKNMLPGPPPTRFLITMNPSGEVTCDVRVEVCVTLDPCTGMLDPVLFPCPPPGCQSNPYSVDNICETALQNPLCDLRVIQSWPCGRNPLEYGPWLNQTQCSGDRVYHNTSFYGFVAGSGNYDINFTIFQCAGSGVQYGILDGVCSPGGPCVIYNGTATTGTVTINSSILTPCKTYVLCIDGFAGSVCSYYAFVTGNWHNCSVPPIIDISLDSPCDPLCPSFNPITVTATGDPTSVPPVEEISGAVYYWDVTEPDGTTSNYVIEGPDGLHIDYVFYQEGTYKVCVTPYHPCDLFGKQYCEEYRFAPIEDEYQKFVVCTGDFPWSGAYDEDGKPIVDKYGNQYAWVGGDITLEMVRKGGGIWETGSYYVNECGCQYLQQILIVEDKTGIGKDFIAVCKGDVPYDYKGFIIDSDIDDELIKLEGVITKNGCDSVVSLTARVLDMDGKITNTCISGGVELKFSMGIAFEGADRDSLKYVWKDTLGNVIPDLDKDSTTIVVSGEEKYTLEITIYKYGKPCTFTFTHTVDLSELVPKAPIADNWPQKICESDPEARYSVLNPDTNLVYLWMIPATATKVKDDSSGTLIVRWNGPTGEDICVKARNWCGDGPQTCLPVVNQLPPIIDISVDSIHNPLCASFDSILIAALGDSASVPPIEAILDANYYWDITNPDGSVNSYTIEGVAGLNLYYIFYQEGAYNVCVTAYDPCDQLGKLYCKEIQINCTVSTSEGTTSKPDIIPNPAVSTIKIEGLEAKEYGYMLYQYDGRYVGSGHLSEDHLLDIHLLKQGIYILMIESKDGRYRTMQKVVKIE